MTDIHARLIGLPERVASDKNLRRIGRFCTVQFLLEIGTAPWHFDVANGELRHVHQGPFRMRSWAFAIRAPEESWRHFWSGIPAPGYNDIFAMTSYGHAHIDGDMTPLLKDLRFLKALIELPRGTLDSPRI